MWSELPRANVQVIQATNVPRVSNDQGYAALLHDLTGPGSAAAQGNFDGVGNAPLRRRTAGPSPLQPRTHAPSQITPPAASPPPPPTQRPPSPLTADVAVGRTVLVPRSVYPTYGCTEHGGRGWEAVIRSASSKTAVVRYAHAATSRGRRYADMRLPLRLLELL